MNWITLLLILVSVCMSACAQILLKVGMTPSGNGPDATLMATALRVLLNPWVIGGLGLYFLGAVVWLSVLSRVEVSYAYPFVGLGFIATMILGTIFLGEHVGPIRVVGSLLIVSGIVLVARS